MADLALIVGAAAVAGGIALDLAGHVVTNRRLSRDVLPRIAMAEARGERIEAALAELKPGTLKGGLNAAEMSQRAVAAREEKALTREEGDSHLLAEIGKRFGLERAMAIRDGFQTWMPEKWAKAAENVHRWEGIIGPFLQFVQAKQSSESAPSSARMETY